MVQIDQKLRSKVKNDCAQLKILRTQSALHATPYWICQFVKSGNNLRRSEIQKKFVNRFEINTPFYIVWEALATRRVILGPRFISDIESITSFSSIDSLSDLIAIVEHLLQFGASRGEA